MPEPVSNEVGMTSAKHFSDVGRRIAELGLSRSGADPFGADASLGEELRALVFALVTRWRVVGLTATAVVLLAIAYIWTTPPIYSATTELLIDPRSRQIVGGEVAPTGLGSSALGSDTLLLDSQINVMLSQSVLRRLIEEQNLAENPEFAGTGTSVLGFVKQMVAAVVRGPQGTGIEPESPYDMALRNVSRRLDVSRLGNTYVVAITFRSEDAATSARLADAVAGIYIDETTNAVRSNTLEAAQSLKDRLEELRHASFEADARVETFRGENDLIGTQDLLVVEQQLRDLNNQLVLAQVATQNAFAELEQARKADVLPKTGEGGAILESEVLAQLQVRYAALQAEEASLATSLMPGHPRLARILQEKASIRRAMEAEYERILGRLQSAYDSALDKERAIESQAGRMQAQMVRTNAASVRLRELEREAESTRAIYQTFMNRAKEAWEQVGLPSSTVRIISPAFAPSRPAHPQVVLILLASGVLGLMAGLGLAWLLHLMNGTPRPRPRQRRPAPDFAYRTNPAAPAGSLANS